MDTCCPEQGPIGFGLGHQLLKPHWGELELGSDQVWCGLNLALTCSPLQASVSCPMQGTAEAHHGVPRVGARREQQGLKDDLGPPCPERGWR